MTRVPASSEEPARRLHQIDAAVSALVRLLARQAAQGACPEPNAKDAQENGHHDQD